jgi:hypothetical protein
VQQGADGRRGDHRLRQPAVQGYEGGLDPEPGDQEDEDRHELAAVVLDQGGQRAARPQLGFTAQHLHPGHPGQQQHAPAQRVGQVATNRRERRQRSPVDHERVRGQGQRLVEDEEGQEVAGQRHPHRRRH